MGRAEVCDAAVWTVPWDTVTRKCSCHLKFSLDGRVKANPGKAANLLSGAESEA